MNPSRWQQIDEIFEQALVLGPDARKAFLDAACKNSDSLLHEVQQLLMAFDAAVTFLEIPAGESFGLTSKPNKDTLVTSGQQVAHYQIISQLGVGGMGEVYLAHDLKLDRQIALKLLPAHFAADSGRIKRFESEARAASALNHPNIITIHEIGSDAGKHFIATEYIAGETLRKRLNRGGLSSKEAIDIARQVASALVAAHRAGLIHRDIKPENIMIWPDGRVKVLDFGLAKQLHSGLDPAHSEPSVPTGFETDPDYLIGSLNYLSPEQVRRDQLDERTDLFSLGVVLYEMTAGVRPFTGSTASDTCANILNLEPRPLADATLWSIISKALNKRRETRYQSADDLLSALSLRRGEGTGKRLLLVLAVILAVAGVAGFWWWKSRSNRTQRSQSFMAAVAQKLTTMPGQELFPRLSPDGKNLIFSSVYETNWDIYSQVVGDRAIINLTPNSNSSEFQATYSPDGKQIAFRSTRDGGGVFVMNSDGINVSKLLDHGYNPSWSPDGTEVAVAEDICWDYEARNTYPSASRLWAVNISTRTQRLVTDQDAVQPDWSPQGKRIAFWGEQKGGHRDIWTVAASGGKPVPVTDDGFIDWNPIWSGDGRQLYFLSNRGGEMNLWSVGIDENSGRVLTAPEPATLPSNNCQHVSLARNIGALVYGQTTRSENLVQIGFDPDRGQVIEPPTDQTQGLKRYAMFSLAPDEKSFVYLARGEPHQDLFTAQLNGSPLVRLTDDVAQDIVPRWSPDGNWIAFLSDRSGKYEIWKIKPDGSGLTQVTNEPGREVIAPVWLPDSRHLLYEVRNVNSYIVDTEDSTVAKALPGEQPPSFIPWEISPDGTYLAGWQHSVDWGIVIYSFNEQRYQRITAIGAFPTWLADSSRLIFREVSDLYLVDRRGDQAQKIYSSKGADIGTHLMSRDSRRLYFSSISSESDVWLLKLSQ